MTTLKFRRQDDHGVTYYRADIAVGTIAGFEIERPTAGYGWSVTVLRSAMTPESFGADNRLAGQAFDTLRDAKSACADVLAGEPSEQSAGRRVYVATIDTRYEVIAVATTELKARQAAAMKAMAYLRQNGCSSSSSDWDTVEKMDDYLGITVTVVTLDGLGDFVGNAL